MTSKFTGFAQRLIQFMQTAERATDSDVCNGGTDAIFNELALELFWLQYAHNPPYRRLCEARGVSQQGPKHWAEIPAAPTVGFKEFEFSCLLPEERTTVFHSTGTTGQNPSRHFHSAFSLRIYEASAWAWFRAKVLPDLVSAGAQQMVSAMPDEKPEKRPRTGHDFWRLLCLTPPPAQVPHSSLVHMFELIRRQCGFKDSVFAGRLTSDGAWMLDFNAACEVLKSASDQLQPLVLLGTATLLVSLVDHLTKEKKHFNLAPGSRVMETGGYKGRVRMLPKAELYALIAQRLSIPQSHIVSEYGMSELSSQAYDQSFALANDRSRPQNVSPSGIRCESLSKRPFRFPPWARVQIVSPETGREAGLGETGLIRVFDLANIFSVLAVQTDDLGIMRPGGFELVGRAAFADARGCSLLAA